MQRSEEECVILAVKWKERGHREDFLVHFNGHAFNKQAFPVTRHYFTLQGKDLEVFDKPSWEIFLMRHTDRIYIASTLYLTI